MNHPGRVELEEDQSCGNDLAIVKRLRKSFNKNQTVRWRYVTKCRMCGQQKSDTWGGSACPKQPIFNGLDAAPCLFGDADPHLSPYDRGLLDHAMRRGHQVFEGVTFTFHVECPIKVARDWFRYRTHAFNEVSTRFDLIEPRVYIPVGERMRAQVGKIGEHKFSPLLDPFNGIASEIMREGLKDAMARYQALIGMGVAREAASYILPLATMTSFYDTVNLRNLWHFLDQRSSFTGEAIWEMQVLADECERLARAKCPEAFDVWDKYGRKTV